jgi:hypothetical protein
LLVSILNKEGFAPVLTDEEIQHFKQMEKEQIVNAYWDGGQDVPMHISTCEKYYNETFGVETGVIVFDNIHLTNTNKINNGGNNE